MESYANWDATRFIEILNIYKVKKETYSGFAIRMGFKSHKIFQDWRKGQKPRVESLLQIKEKLGISQDHFDIMTDEVYGVVLRKCNNTLKEMKTSEITSALQRPLNPVVEQILTLRRGDESEFEFLDRIGVPVDLWEDWMHKELKDISLLDFTKLLADIADKCDKRDRDNIEAIITWYHKNRKHLTGKRSNVGIKKVSFHKQRIA